MYDALNQRAEVRQIGQVERIRDTKDSLCATKGDRCGVAGEPPNLSCSALGIASKCRVRVGRTIEAIVNSKRRIGVRAN